MKIRAWFTHVMRQRQQGARRLFYSGGYGLLLLAVLLSWPAARQVARQFDWSAAAQATPVCCGNWQQKSVAGPSARDVSAVAYARKCNRTVLFGGRTVGGVPPANVTNDTWEWDGAALTWTLTNPAVKPPARGEHKLAYDDARGVVVLFGGFTSTFGGLNDTWEYDCATDTWTQRTPVNSPPARHAFAMAYDPLLNLTVLHGGAAGLSDTWTWNGTNWTQVAGANQPGGRADHSMAFDGTRIIMFGGVTTGAVLLGDTWGFTGSAWTQLATTGPAARQRHNLAQDSLCQRVILFGGNLATVDTWEWDGMKWCQVTAATQPSRREYPAMAFDGRRVVLFGGQASNLSQLGDTWNFNCNRPYTYRAGRMDNFNPPTDPTLPSAAFLANVNGVYGNPLRKHFDDPATDSFFLHSFTGLPTNIVRAELEVRMRPEAGGTGNDSIHFDFPPFNAPSFTWGQNMFALHPGGTWNAGQGAHTFVLDLGSLPPGSTGQPTDLLSRLNTHHALNIMIQDDTNVDYMKLRVWVCPRRTYYAGLPVTAKGQAQLSTEADGNLAVSNIGVTGNDGATFVLNEAQAVSMETGDPLSGMPIGSYMQSQSFGRINGVPNSPAGGFRFTRTPDGRLTFTPDFSPLGSPTFHATFFLNGATVNAQGGLSGDVLSWAPNNSRLTIKCVWKRRIWIIFNPNEDWLLRVGNQDVGTGNTLVVSAENPTLTVDSVSHAELTGAMMPTIRVGPITIDPDLPSAQERTLATALGEAALEPFAGNLSVAGIGADGTDGVRINLGKAENYNLSLDDLDPMGTAPLGATVRVSSRLNPNLLPPPPPKDEFLTVARVSPTHPAFTKQYEVTASTSQGAMPMNILLFNGATQVAAVNNFSGRILTSAWPSAIGRPGPTTLGYQLDFPSGTIAGFGPCPPAPCDQLPTITHARVTWVFPPAASAYLTEVSVTASNLPEFTLTGLAVTPFCNSTINVAPATLRTGWVGRPYTEQLSASGGIAPYSFTATGLPSGLSLTSFGVLSGTPTQNGSFNMDVTATDANGCTGTKSYVLTVNVCPAVTVNPAALPNGTLGATYNQSFTASGGTGPYSFTRVSGTLPPGLTLAGSGVLNGTPMATGSFNFTAQATDANGCTGTRPYTLVIDCQVIAVNPANPTLPPGAVGAAYSQTFTQTGGTGSITWSRVTGTLPPGLTLNANTALLSGTPTQSGTFNFTVQAADANGCTGSRNYTLVINCSTITVNPANPTLPAGTAGTAYNQTFTATGGTGPYTFVVSAGALPAGLTLNSAAGLLSGTPTVFGVFNFTVQATDAGSCTGTRDYTLTINAPCVPGAITVNPATAPNGFVGTAYNQSFTASGGTGPYTFARVTGTLPPGLTLATSGALTGTPTTEGSFNFTVRATAANDCLGERGYTVVISGTGLQFYALDTPVRALETRPGLPVGCVKPSAPIATGTTFTLGAVSACTGIPANARAIAGNVTVVPGNTGGYLTLFPSNAAQPIVANSNFKPSEVTNNVFTVGLGATDGAFKIFASATTHVVVDITGYFAPPSPTGLYFHILNEPVRLVETRALPGLTGCIKPGAPFPVGTTEVQGRTPVAAPCNVIPAAARAMMGNITVVNPALQGFLTIWPSDAVQPTVAGSNYLGADIINAPFTVKLGTDGKFKVFTPVETHLVIDILGYYSTEAVDANGAGLLFNILPKPVRQLETRPDFPGFPPLTGCFRPNAPIQGGTGGIRTQPIWGTCEGVNIPTVARAIMGNVTVVNPRTAGFLTHYPGNVGTPPTVATSNYPFPVFFGYNRHFTVGLSPTDGTFKILTQATTELIVDVSGYFAP